MRLFVMYDVVARKAGPVFESENNETAVRALAGLPSPKGCKANDFELRAVGEIERDGTIVPLPLDVVATFPVEDSV